MIKGIIFDLGNTLIEFKGNLAETERKGAEAVGQWYIKKKRIKLDAEALAEAILTCRAEGLALANQTLQEFKMSDGIATALQQTGAPERAIPLAPQAVKAFFEAEEAACFPLDNSPAILKELYKQGYKLGVLSNATDDDLVQRLVNGNGLRPWLSPVFSSAKLGWRKPKAEPFALIAQRWNLQPAQIAVVGDTLGADILGAQNAGMKGVWLNRIPNPANEANSHIEPEAHIVTLSDLAEIIAKIE